MYPNNGETRTKNVIKNATVTILAQILKNIIAFITRTIFIYILGAEYLGVNGLFSDILMLLSFVELGIGNAINYSLYKPIAENDKEKIKTLMKLYEKSYRIIALVVTIAGISLIPFINDIVGEVSYLKENIILIYFLYLINTTTSYLFAYKKSIIIAYQKNYIVDICSISAYLVQSICQSIFLVLTHNFYLYLIFNILFNGIANIIIARIADRLLPFLKDKVIVQLNKEEKKNIMESIKALFVYKIGSVVLESVDSIFISGFISIVTVGYYSNYKLIVNLLKTVSSQAMSSVVATVGNLNAVSDRKKKKMVFDEMLYGSAWIVSFCTVGLFIFISPFIKLWIGDEYVLDNNVVLPICLYYFVSFMHIPCYTYRTTTKVFIYGRYVPLLAVVLNLFFDFVLGRMWGLGGIVWGTVFARLLTYEIIDPYLIYKYIFQESIRTYYVKYVKYIIVTVISGGCCYYIAKLISNEGWMSLFIQIVIVTLLYNILYLIFTVKMKDGDSLKKRIVKTIKEKYEK